MSEPNVVHIALPSGYTVTQEKLENTGIPIVVYRDDGGEVVHSALEDNDVERQQVLIYYWNEQASRALDAAML